MSNTNYEKDTKYEKDVPKASIRKDILHPELSYEIVGALFDVFRELSFGHKEKYYENAVAGALENRGLRYQRQKRVSLSFAGKEIGYYFLDFLVEDTIVLELKQGDFFPIRILTKCILI